MRLLLNRRRHDLHSRCLSAYSHHLYHTHPTPRVSYLHADREGGKHLQVLALFFKLCSFKFKVLLSLLDTLRKHLLVRRHELFV